MYLNGNWMLKPFQSCSFGAQKVAPDVDSCLSLLERKKVAQNAKSCRYEVAEHFLLLIEPTLSSAPP